LDSNMRISQDQMMRLKPIIGNSCKKLFHQSI
jgi:hypothetical protein